MPTRDASATARRHRALSCCAYAQFSLPYRNGHRNAYRGVQLLLVGGGITHGQFDQISAFSPFLSVFSCRICNLKSPPYSSPSFVLPFGVSKILISVPLRINITNSPHSKIKPLRCLISPESHRQKHHRFPELPSPNQSTAEQHWFVSCKQ